MRIAVLSDTHGLLRPEVMEIVNTCDAVLHGGDIKMCIRDRQDSVSGTKEKGIGKLPGAM